jgi:hypothetical protein
MNKWPSSALVAVCCIGQAHAAPVTFDFTYTVTSVNGNISQLPPLGLPTVGQDYNVSFTFDDAAALAFSNNGLAQYTNALIGVDFSSIGYTGDLLGFSSTNTFVGNSVNGTSNDLFIGNSTKTGAGPSSLVNGSGISIRSFELVLEDEAGSVFTSESLSDALATGLGTDLFSDATLLISNFSIEGINGSNTGIFGSIATASPVPIPAAAWLFGSALLGLGVLRKKS